MNRTSYKPRITVVTVVRNAADALRKTIGSVLSQDWPDLEFILVDGGSDDGSADVIREHAARIAWWVSEPDHGIYDAMNKGLARATGEWVSFMNAGDVFSSPDILSTVFSQDIADCAVVYGDSYARYPHGSVYRRAGEPADLVRGMVFCHQAAFVRRSLIPAEGFDPAFRIGADYDLFCRLLAGGHRFYRLSCPVAVFDASGVSNMRMVQSAREHYRIVRNYFPLGLSDRFHHWKFISWVGLVSLGYRLLPEKLVHFGRKHKWSSHADPPGNSVRHVPEAEMTKRFSG